jgi:hypothetical protein
MVGTVEVLLSELWVGTPVRLPALIRARDLIFLRPRSSSSSLLSRSMKDTSVTAESDGVPTGDGGGAGWIAGRFGFRSVFGGADGVEDLCVNGIVKSVSSSR